MSSIIFEPDKVDRELRFYDRRIHVVLQEHENPGDLATARLFLDLHMHVAAELREILDEEIDRVLNDAYAENEQRDRVAQRNLAIIGGGTELLGEVG